MHPHVIDLLSSHLSPSISPQALIWSGFPRPGFTLSPETPVPPHLPLVLHPALCPLSSWVQSPVFCICGLSGSYYLMWRVFPSTLPLPIPPFSGYILPRDCVPTVMILFQPFSYCLSVLSPLRSPIVNPSLSPNYSPSHNRPPSPSSVSAVSTLHVQYTSPLAVLLFLHQYTLPGAREGTYRNLSLVVRSHHTFLPSHHSSHSPLDLIVEHFPGGS